MMVGLAGTILGWMGLSDIRAHQGKLRGVPFAVFAALALPLLLLVGAVAAPLWFFLITVPARSGGIPLIIPPLADDTTGRLGCLE